MIIWGHEDEGMCDEPGRLQRLRQPRGEAVPAMITIRDVVPTVPLTIIGFDVSTGELIVIRHE